LVAAAGMALLATGCARDSRLLPETLQRSPGPTPLIRIAITNPQSISPLTSSSRWGVFTVKTICDTLVGFDPGTGTLKPAIAQSWTIAPDGKKVTFKIRPGVKFHNQRDLVAADYVWSLSRFAHPKTGSAQRFLFDKVAGYQELQAGRAETLAGVLAPDPSTLEINLSTPFAEFPAVMAYPNAGAAVPKEEVEKSAEAFDAKPVCTGPYALEAPWNAGDGIKLQQFAGYYGENQSFSHGGRGHARRIEMDIVSDEDEAYGRLEAGGAGVSPVPLGRLAAARAVSGRLSSGPSGHVSYIGLPVKRGPYDNERFRMALALAIDRKGIVGGLLGKSRQVPGGFLPASAGRASQNACGDSVKPSADPEGAKAALAAAGVDPAATKPSVYFNSGGGHEKWVEAVASGWKSILGIEPALQPREWNEYLNYLADPGPEGPFRLAWAVKFPSAEAMCEPLFSSSSLDNFSRFSSPEFDGLLAKARSTADDETRARIYAEANAVLCRQIPIIPMWFGLNHMAFSGDLEAVPGSAGGRVDVFGDPVVRDLASFR
ncbi:MAG: ABC transporter substrate-binding protein, partial [Actinomycetota bacterium]